MMSASRILVLFNLDLCEIVDFLVFEGARLLNFRDFLGTLLIGYYMRFSNYLAIWSRIDVL